MAYGIRIENSSGFTQIDQDFVNYVLVASGSFSSTGTSDSPKTHTVNFSALVSSPDTMFFARPTTTASVGSSFPGMAGSSTGTVATIQSFYTGTIQWQVYQRSSALSVPSSGYGLNVFRPNGELAFSSQYKIPRIFSIIESNLGFGNMGTASHSYSAIPYALMQNGYEWAFYPEDDPIPDTLYYMVTSWTSTSVSVDSFSVDTFQALNFFQLTGSRVWAFIQG
jgi:hypothetical protein